MSLVEGLEDWAVKAATDKVLAGYIAKGEIAAREKPIIERAAIDIANAILAELARTVGATDPAAPAKS